MMASIARKNATRPARVGTGRAHRYTGHRRVKMAQDRFSVPAGEPDDGRTPSEYGVPKLRRQILQRLADAYADDNLELSEYERRVRAAEYAATIDQLEALVADFPARPAPPRASPARRAPTPGATVTIMGERKLDVQAAQDLPRQVINVMGATRIDLSDAPPGVYELRVYNLMGELQVAVPYGTQVNRTLWSLLSDVSVRPWKAKRTARARFTSHQVTLTGISLMGEVTIREESSGNAAA